MPKKAGSVDNVDACEVAEMQMSVSAAIVFTTTMEIGVSLIL
jgi:flavin-binding protein dodecin